MCFKISHMEDFKTHSSELNYDFQMDCHISLNLQLAKNEIMWHLAYSYAPKLQAFCMKWARLERRAISQIHFFNNLPEEPANRILKYVRDSINIFARAPTLNFPIPCVSLLFYLV